MATEEEEDLKVQLKTGWVLFLVVTLITAAVVYAGAKYHAPLLLAAAVVTGFINMAVLLRILERSIDLLLKKL